MAAVSPQRAKTLVWRAAFGRWPAAPASEPGYTLLLPVPADLPVFLHLALANAAWQERTGRIETLVVPDMPSAAFTAALATALERHDPGPVRLVEPGRRARVMRRLANAPAANYFLQVHAGACAATGTHLLLHDADLFIEDRGFMARHYETARSSGAGCLGVSPAWDDWLREHGFDHVVATWELMLDLGWLRAFPPWHHRPGPAFLDGEWHVFDVTLRTQAVSPPDACRLHEATDSFEHFNWVIGVYRYFQQATGPFEDDRFLLLLVRLLSDAYDAPAPGLPDVAGLAAGIADPARTVTYVDPETPGKYPTFRAKLERILAGPLFDDATAARIRSGVAPFDAAFAGPRTSPAAAPPAAG